MKYLSMILAAGLLNASALANPVRPATSSKSATVTCSPKDLSKNKVVKQKVSVATAKAQMKVAGLQEGRSGDPHRFYNSEKIHWNVPACDKPSAHLMEYPVYEAIVPETWAKDSLTDGQTATAIRVVFANANGASVYCGVMTHDTINIPKGVKRPKAPPFIQCH